MKDDAIDRYISILCQRVLPDGGFANQPGDPCRPDATAWAIMALVAADTHADLVDAARARLAANQHRDGRIVIAQDHPEAYWPTPLAVLAWQGSPKYRDQMDQAVAFLLRAHGNPPLNGIDVSPSLHPGGWPWLAGTYTWVEPTALSLLALRSVGYGGNERCREGERMLAERQLPHGGWNYGNTVVYGQELRPQPDATGLALVALAGCIPRKDVKRSLDYLNRRTAGLHTPLSLAWGYLGLSAWGDRPEQARSRIAECCALQEKYGSYDTTHLALLILAYLDNGRLAGIHAVGGSA